MSAHDQILDLKARMGQSIIGQVDVIDRLIIGLLANGNLLVEGLPGLAKTRAIKSSDTAASESRAAAKNTSRFSSSRFVIIVP